jgi:hypothetical protein
MSQLQRQLMSQMQWQQPAQLQRHSPPSAPQLLLRVRRCRWCAGAMELHLCRPLSRRMSLVLQVVRWSDGTYLEDQDMWRLSGLHRCRRDAAQLHAAPPPTACAGLIEWRSAGHIPVGATMAATPRHATPRHATPRHATPRHATPRHATPRHATPRHATPRHATPRHATPRHATPRHATPRHATPRHATPHAASCRPVLLLSKPADAHIRDYTLRTPLTFAPGSAELTGEARGRVHA